MKTAIFIIKADEDGRYILKKKKWLMLFHLCCCPLSVPHYILTSRLSEGQFSTHRERIQYFSCVFFSSYAKQESCQAIVVWYGEGSWDLVTGTFLLAQTAISQQFPQGVKLVMMQGDGHLMTRSTNLLHNTVINKGVCFCRSPPPPPNAPHHPPPPDIAPHSNVNHLSCFSLSHFCLSSLTY